MTDEKKLTSADLELLARPFPEDRLGVKVQSLNKDRTKAMLVCYLQHTDVYDRLEKVDPNWTSEVLDERRDGDTTYVRLRMTLKGVSRENVGEGGDPKSALSDALKRCAMLFGVGRYLYDSETVWVDYNDQKDRFRTWTLAEFNAVAKRRGQAQTPTAPETNSPPAPPAEPSPKESASPKATKPKPAPSPEKAAQATQLSMGVRPREELLKVCMDLYRPFKTRFPRSDLAKILADKFGGRDEVRLLNTEELEQFVQYLERAVAGKHLTEGEKNG